MFSGLQLNQANLSRLLSALGVVRSFRTSIPGLSPQTATTGDVVLSGNLRERLLADRTYYVRTDGSNSNNGLTNTAGGAFRTIDYAIALVYDTLDLNDYDVTIQVADGTYTTGVDRETPQVGDGRITLKGNLTTPGNCIINATGNGVKMYNGATIYVAGFKIVSTARSLYSAWGGMIYANRMEFGAAGDYQVRASAGYIWFTDFTAYGSISYSITGGATNCHYSAHVGGNIYASNAVVTITGTPTFTSFATSESGGSIEVTGATFTGSISGLKYQATWGGSVSPVGFNFPGTGISIGNGGMAPTGIMQVSGLYSASTYQVNINDDAVYSVQVDGISIGIMLIDINTVGGAKTSVPRGSFGARIGVGGGGGAFTENISLDLTNVTLTTGVLTGTTGTDGKFTISAASDSKLYFENRTGSVRQITLRILP